MASTSRAREGAIDDRSAGGKILRRRRNPRATPYDRPSPVTVPSPNWLTGVVLPKIATGAASLLSSFISSPDDSSSSSSENDDSRDASSSDGSDESTHSHYGVDMLNKNASTPEFDKGLRKKCHLTIGKSETKELIEKLIMQETFSREECDSLMGLINSRVIDGSTRNKGLITGSDIPDSCTKAIMEAKQWIEEKKGSSSKLQLAHGISTPNSVMLPQDTRIGLSSPVDLARAYMRDRAPFSSSPLLNYGIEKTPLRVESNVLKDDAPHGHSVSSSKRKLSSGSWSIQDELRRVRSKATEDMLKTVSSQKNTLSSFSLEPEGIGTTLLNDRIELRQEDSNLFPSVKLIDASSNLTAAGVGTSACLPVSAVDTIHDNIQTEDLQLQPVTVAQIQGIENIQKVKEDKRGADGSRQSAIQEPFSEDDVRFSLENGPTADGDIQLRGKTNSREVENSHQPPDGKNSNALSNSREERCELLSETSIKIPSMDEVDEVAIDDSRINSIKSTEESSKSSTRPRNLKQTVKAKSTKIGIGADRKLRPKGRAT